MAYSAAQSQMLGEKKVLDPLIADLITLSYECKRKYQPIKEAAEACQLKVRGIGAKGGNVVGGLLSSSQEIIQPFIMACDTKNPKLVQMSLTAIQKLISQQTIDATAASSVVGSLWLLMEARVEELKLLQTAILLITTNSVVQHETLSKALALCFRMHFAKDATTTNTAAATVRQLVSAIFDRVIAEDELNLPASESMPGAVMDELKSGCRKAPLSLRCHAGDAFMLFQDFCQLLNVEQPFWLTGMNEMTRALCLELVEEVLTNYRSVFVRHSEFTFLLSEKVCPLIIRLFSPSLKYRVSKNCNTSSNNATFNNTTNEKPVFPIVIRLLRIVSVLVQRYSSLLITESEIFLSLLVKFLDPEKAPWQRLAALEVLNKLCVRPELIKSFCQSYDMKPHSTKVLRDIINGVGVFIQSQFINPSFIPSFNPIGSTTRTTGDTVNSVVIPAGNNNNNNPHPQQSMFIYRNIAIPLLTNVNISQGSHKSVILDMLDKTEATAVMEGYGLSLAFICLLDTIKSIDFIVNNQRSPSTAQNSTAASNPLFSTGTDTAAVRQVVNGEEKQFLVELIASSWCGILSALLLLLEASTDDSISEVILTSMLTYTSLCASLSCHTPRDAFVTALCKNSLPPYYNLAVFTGTSHSSPNTSPNTTASGSTPTDLKHSQRQVSQQDLQAALNDNQQLSQVVAVGTVLNTSSTTLSLNQGPVVLTTKNIQCMKTLLQLAQSHGAYLSSSWYQVLLTLQHLSWILGLRPVPGGGMQASTHATDNLTTSSCELPQLSQLLSCLFESSQRLDDVSLVNLIEALCRISTEVLDAGLNNKEPSLFALAKLQETGLVNLFRVQLFWACVTKHLLEACQHPHTQIRVCAAETITCLLKSAFYYKHATPIDQQPKLQGELLVALQGLSKVPHTDIKHKQLECVLHLIQSNGEGLTGNGWLLLLHVMGDVASSGQGESLVRLAFQSLQLVVTDFLLSLPSAHLASCVDVVAMFATQQHELNISLTAIGLLWNIADHFSQNRSKISSDLVGESTKKDDTTSFDALWLGLYCSLGQLCVDTRPAIRKSSGQTLFSMIAAHGWLLELQAWHNMLWKVLFPLLDNVKRKSTQPATESMTQQVGPKNILMHHSRDTAEKQWAETRFLTLAGVVRVASIKRKTLRALGDFTRAWTLLLEYIEDAALCQNDEVSLAALKSFQELLSIKSEESKNWEGVTTEDRVNQLFSNSDKSFVETSQPTSTNLPGKGVKASEDQALWHIAWKVWTNIGLVATSLDDHKNQPPFNNDLDHLTLSIAPSSSHQAVYLPSQAFLTALMQTFNGLYDHIKEKFNSTDLNNLFLVLQRALSIPLGNSNSSFFLLTSDFTLSPLQEAILDSIKLLGKSNSKSGKSNEGSKTYEYNELYPEVIKKMLPLIEYSINPPIKTPSKTKASSNHSAFQTDSSYLVAFSESVMRQAHEMYKCCAQHDQIIKQAICQHIIKSLSLPLSKKYSCPFKTTWVLAVTTLLDLLKLTLPIAIKHEKHFESMWLELGKAIESFLFSTHPNPVSMSQEEFEKDEQLDCFVVETLRDEVLPHSNRLPAAFIHHIMDTLNKGSIHTINSTTFLETDSTNKLREDFAKICFETLLQFSFMHQSDNKRSDAKSESKKSDGVITSLAIEALLKRCRDVLEKFVDDSKHCGNFPLPRPQMTEVTVVLQAVTTLLLTLKKNPAIISKSQWRDAINLYPYLVECSSSSSSSPSISRSVRESLLQYKDLIQAPFY